MQQRECGLSELVQPAQGGGAAIAVRANAWDCHMHIFGPFDRFPVAKTGPYALPDADRHRHAGTLAALGFRHALLIQPSPYGTDHRAMLDALDHGEGRFRGIGSSTRTPRRRRWRPCARAAFLACDSWR